MRRFLAPEVVQTSALDCGPAALKCLLEGYRIPVAYGRLREACQTGLDGTSIDTLEVVANQLGLIAGQVLLPVDHLLLREAKAFPCLLVTTLPNGVTHFVVLWRKHGSLLQVMDPAVGRRWVSTKEFLREVYAHTMPAEADEWRHFAASEDSRKMFAERMRKVGLRSKRQLTLVTNALHDEGWRSLAILDAAIRLVAALRDSGAIRSADDSARLLERMIANPECIPERYWSVRSAPQDSAGGEQVLVQGAVLIRILGSQPPASGEELGTELSAALSARAASPGRELFNVFWHSGRLAIALILCGLVVSAAATLGEGLLFRGLLDISTELGLAGQRMGAMSALAFFCVALLFLELPVFLYSVRIGRYIENRLRLKFLEKIPRLSDRYFQSRLISDMAERSHVAHRLRDLAGHVHQLLRAVLEFTFTAAGIVWLEPSYSHHMMAIAAVALAPPFLLQSLLTERDLRVRTHAAGLTRFYLDAMLGLVAVRAHGAENAVRRDHERFLGEWANASVRLQRTAAALEAAQLTALFGLIGGLFLWHPLEGADIGRTLLIAYWALNLPALGQEIGTLLRQYPAYRNLTLRLMEPLSAPEETPACEIPFGPGECAAPSLTFDAVFAAVSGHAILEDLSATIPAGRHVAIVGPSGAGKSSLFGLILGWLKPVSGRILLDGEPLNPETLRSIVAWVDPAVQLWNRSLTANLSYGGTPDAGEVAQAIDDAMLRSVLETLPRGLQTELGESGALVSGGEGQRVRLARAFLRKTTRLVLLDEPFRGLDREKRSELLLRARSLWRDCTLLCITHDISQTQAFDDVLVIENARLVESGSPQALAADPNSRYARMLAAEQEAHASVWKSALWRRIRLHGGRIVEDLPAREVPAVSHDELHEAEVA